MDVDTFSSLSVANITGFRRPDGTFPLGLAEAGLFLNGVKNFTADGDT